LDGLDQGLEPVGQPQGDPVAGEHREPQAGGQQAAAIRDVLDEHLQQSGNRVPEGDPMPRDEIQPVRGLAG
jgi:hypothetical protein